LDRRKGRAWWVRRTTKRRYRLVLHDRVLRRRKLTLLLRLSRSSASSSTPKAQPPLAQPILPRLPNLLLPLLLLPLPLPFLLRILPNLLLLFFRKAEPTSTTTSALELVGQGGVQVEDEVLGAKTFDGEAFFGVGA
jgi:hypothetical protein